MNFIIFSPSLSPSSIISIVILDAIVTSYYTSLKSGYYLHCYKTEGEIPVHRPGAATRQRHTPGKCIRNEGGVFTCTVLGNFTVSGNFRIIFKNQIGS